MPQFEVDLGMGIHAPLPEAATFEDALKAGGLDPRHEYKEWKGEEDMADTEMQASNSRGRAPTINISELSGVGVISGEPTAYDKPPRVESAQAEVDRLSQQLSEGHKRLPRKPRADKGTHHEKKAASEPPKPAPRRSRAKSNITEEDIGGIYQAPDGNVFRLLAVAEEPVADMVGISGESSNKTEPLSFFQDWIKLEPRKKR